MREGCVIGTAFFFYFLEDRDHSVRVPICAIRLSLESFKEYSKKFLGKLFQITRKTLKSLRGNFFNKIKSLHYVDYQVLKEMLYGCSDLCYSLNKLRVVNLNIFAEPFL